MIENYISKVKFSEARLKAKPQLKKLEHWIWIGPISNRSSRIRAKVNGRWVDVDRYLWEQVNGKIEKGYLSKIRSCTNPLCVNPEHYYLDTDFTRATKGEIPKPKESLIPQILKARGSRAEIAHQFRITPNQVAKIFQKYGKAS